MARGRKAKTETVAPEDILNIGEEIGTPNIIIDDEFGISGKLLDYTLAQKKIATRTAKEEDIENYGEDCVGKVIQYYKWDDIGYFGTIQACYEKYIAVNTLTGIKKLEKEKDFGKVVDIFKQARDTINKSLQMLQLDEESAHTCELYDDITTLRTAIKEANKVIDEAESLHELIKEKRQIIIKDTEPKRHRTPKDEKPLDQA